MLLSKQKNDNYYDEQGSDLNDGLWLVIGTGAKDPKRKKRPKKDYPFEQLRKLLFWVVQCQHQKRFWLLYSQNRKLGGAICVASDTCIH